MTLEEEAMAAVDVQLTRPLAPSSISPFVEFSIFTNFCEALGRERFT